MSTVGSSSCFSKPSQSFKSSFPKREYKWWWKNNLPPSTPHFCGSSSSNAPLTSSTTTDSFQKVSATPVADELTKSTGYAHLVRIGEGSKPSAEFVEKVQQAVTKMMNSLPEKLRNLALKQGFGVKIYHSPSDYINQDRITREGVQAFFPTAVINDMKKVMKDNSQVLKNALKNEYPEKTIDDAYVDQWIEDNTAQVLEHTLFEERTGCKAYYSQGHQNIILHETLPINVPFEDSTDSLENLLRHETGHYFDLTQSEMSQRFSLDPEFRRLLQEDLKAAHASNKFPGLLTPKTDGSFSLSEAELKKIRQHRLTQLRQIHDEEVIKTIEENQDPILNKVTMEHFGYYAPVSEHPTLNDRSFGEAFAEIFASLGGGGPYQEHDLKEIYPQTAKYMRDVIIPKIGELSPTPKGHNGF